MAGPLLSIQDVNELSSLLSDNKALVVLPSTSGNVGQGTLQLGVVDLATYSTFITTAVAARVTVLETTPKPSPLPAPITLTMNGPVTGNVTFDGTSNQSWTSAIANGALSMAMVNGLVSELDTFNTEIAAIPTTYLSLTGGTLTGPTGLTISNTTNGGTLTLVGNGTTTPSKRLRAVNGALQFVNDANSAYIMTLTDAGALSVGSLTTGVGTFTNNVFLNSVPANDRYAYIQSSGVTRWRFGSPGATESGSNVGSDWVLTGFNDAGTYLNTPITVTRATGAVAFGAGISATTAAFSSNVAITGGTLNINRTVTDYNAITLTNTSGVQVQLNANGNSEGNLRTTTNHPLTLSTNNTARVTLDVLGNVGIGTNPSAVPGLGNPVTGANNLVLYNPGNLGLTLTSDSAATRTHQMGFGAAGISIFDAGLKWDTTSRALGFWAGSAQRMTLDVNGNLNLLNAAKIQYAGGATLTSGPAGGTLTILAGGGTSNILSLGKGDGTAVVTWDNVGNQSTAASLAITTAAGNGLNVVNSNTASYSEINVGPWGSSGSTQAGLIRNGSTQGSYAGANSMMLYTATTHAIGFATNNILRGSIDGTTGNWNIVGTLSAASYGGAGVSVAASNSTLVMRHPSGYIFSNYINTTANDIGAAAITSIAVQTGGDGYHRWQTPGNFIAANGIATLSGGPVFTNNNAAGYDVADTNASHPVALTLRDPGAGVGNGGTILFGGGGGAGNNFAYIKGYYTNGGSNGVGLLVFGMRTNTTDTSITNKMVLDNNGYLSLSGPMSANRLFAGWDSGTTGAISCNQWFRATGQTGLYCNDYGGGIYMTDTTYVRAYNGKAMAAADFVITSDEREKAGIRPLEFRGRLQPKSFTMKKDGSLDFGFIAQDVLKNYPEAVGYIEEQDRLQLSYGKLTAIISHQVNAVEDEVAALKNTIAELTERLVAMAAPSSMSERLMWIVKAATQWIGRQFKRH